MLQVRQEGQYYWIRTVAPNGVWNTRKWWVSTHTDTSLEQAIELHNGDAHEFKCVANLVETRRYNMELLLS